MDMVAQVMEKVNNVFDEQQLEKLARETGFITRKRKVGAKQFLEKILFLRLEFPKSSLEELVDEFYKSDTVISKQALHKKFSHKAVEFVKKVLEELLQHTFSEPSLFLGSIPFVRNVQIVDSSEIRLNKVLKNVFPQVRNQGAAIKLHALVNGINDQVLSLEVRPSKEPDQSYKAHIRHVQAGDLLIADRGYFCVASFNEIHVQGGFFLSRYFKNTHLYDSNTKEPIDLRAVLNETSERKVGRNVVLGTSGLLCRLVALRLTEAAYAQRLKNLEERHRKDPRSKANHYDPLNHWTIVITNLPSSVEAEVLLQLYRLRWQIELFFKMMKTFLNLRKIEAVNLYRARVSLYVSLIALTLLSFVTATVIDKEISLYKASKAFIKNVRVFFDFINNKKQCAVSWLASVLGRTALKESRKNRPSTKLLLEVSYA